MEMERIRDDVSETHSHSLTKRCAVTTTAFGVFQGGVSNGTALWLSMFPLSLLFGVLITKYVLPWRLARLDVTPFLMYVEAVVCTVPN